MNTKLRIEKNTNKIKQTNAKYKERRSSYVNKEINAVNGDKTNFKNTYHIAMKRRRLEIGFTMQGEPWYMI